MRSQKPNRKKNKSFFSWLSKGSYQCYPVSHWVDNSEQTKGCWILIFFLKSWLRRGKQMALRLKTIISLPLHSRAFPSPPLPMTGSEIHGLLKFYVWCWELNLEALSCTSSSASLCFKHEAMIWSSRPILCIHRTQWKATKTPVETTPLRELMWEGWGRCTRGENGQARITACEELGGGRDRTKEAGMADSWKASFILATAVWDTWVPFFFSKEKIPRGSESWCKHHRDSVARRTLASWCPALRSVFLMGCSGGETKRRGSSPDCNCWRVVLRVIADAAKARLEDSQGSRVFRCPVASCWRRGSLSPPSCLELPSLYFCCTSFYSHRE